MKWAGCLLVIGAATLMGHVVALEGERRVRELTALLHSAERLETEMVYGLALLADAFESIARDYPECRLLYGVAAKALRQGATARAAWQEGVRVYRRVASLTPDDVRPLQKTAAILGLSSAQDQRRHLQLLRKEIEMRLIEARERLPQKTRLCRSLGLFGGLTAVLLLL